MLFADTQGKKGGCKQLPADFFFEFFCNFIMNIIQNISAPNAMYNQITVK